MKFQKPKKQDDAGTKSKLTWNLVETLTVRTAKAEISRADGNIGRVYSYRLSHIIPGEEGRASQFFREGELENIRELLDNVKVWIEADKHEFEQQRSQRSQRSQLKAS